MILATTVENVSGLTTPWNNIGHHIAGSVNNSADMVKAAKLDWSVALKPINYTTTVETPDGPMTVNRGIPDQFASVRTDTGDTLGIVGKQYVPMQNAVAFDTIDSLLPDGIMQYESAGFFRGGRTVWALAKMPKVDTIAEGDDSLRYILFTTTHDGTGAIHYHPTNVRVICQNTLRAAIKGKKGVKHTGDIAGKIRQAHEIVSQSNAAFDLFVDRAQRLAEKQITGKEAWDYLNFLMPEVKEDGNAKTIREGKVSKIRNNFHNERQTIASVKGTWWAMVNSVTEFYDHQSRFKGNGRERGENKMMSLVGDGIGSDAKEKAFDLAVQMAI